MEQRQLGMELNRKPAIRCGQADGATRNSQTFCDHQRLIGGTSDMLEHRRGVDEVKCEIPKWHIERIGPHVAQPRIHRLEEGCILEARRHDLVLVGIESLKII